MLDLLQYMIRKKARNISKFNGNSNKKGKATLAKWKLKRHYLACQGLITLRRKVSKFLPIFLGLGWKKSHKKIECPFCQTLF